MYMSKHRKELTANHIEVLDFDPKDTVWKQLARIENKSMRVAAIRELRRMHGFGLIYASDIVDAYHDEYMFYNDKTPCIGADNLNSPLDDIIVIPLNNNTSLEIRKRNDGTNDVKLIGHIQSGLSDRDVLQLIAKLA